MKSRTALLIAMVMIFAGLSFTNIAYAGWMAKITATGKDLEGVNKSEVYVGVSAINNTLSDAPSPPDYSVEMSLWKENWSGPFQKDIQNLGLWEYKWIIAVDPHGNIMPPETRTATLNWQPAELGPGSFRLIKGVDGTGEVVVPDMKSISSYQISGGESDQYFTMEYAVVLSSSGLGDTIHILQALTGLTPSSLPALDTDVDGDNQLGLAEVVRILQDVADAP